MEWTSFQWVHCYWTESWVSIFPMSTLILDREWSGYLSNYNSDIGQRIEWISFQWVHWYWTENGVDIFPMSQHLLDIEWYWTEIGVDIFSMSTLILDREWGECLFYNYTDIGWSGYSSFEYIDIGGSVNLCLEYMYTDIGQRMEWVSFLWVLLWLMSAMTVVSRADMRSTDWVSWRLTR